MKNLYVCTARFSLIYTVQHELVLTNTASFPPKLAIDHFYVLVRLQHILWIIKKLDALMFGAILVLTFVYSSSHIAY